MALTEIKRRAKSHIPETYTALEASSKFGDELIDVRVQSIKAEVFGTVVTENAEAGFPPIVLDYCGRKLAIDLIEPGIEYWMNQPSSFSATGQNETKMFTDRAEVLRKLRETLIAKAKEAEAAVGVILGDVANRPIRRKAVIVGQPDNELMVTTDPFIFERPFALPTEEEF